VSSDFGAAKERADIHTSDLKGLNKAEGEPVIPSEKNYYSVREELLEGTYGVKRERPLSYAGYWVDFS
jgi:hypothetical protein